MILDHTWPLISDRMSPSWDGNQEALRSEGPCLQPFRSFPALSCKRCSPCMQPQATMLRASVAVRTLFLRYWLIIKNLSTPPKYHERGPPLTNCSLISPAHSERICRTSTTKKRTLCRPSDKTRMTLQRACNLYRSRFWWLVRPAYVLYLLSGCGVMCWEPESCTEITVPYRESVDC